jgi:hypothetical protein
MRALKINVEQQCFEIVELNANDTQAILKHIGNGAQAIDAAYFPKHVIYVDEEGAYAPPIGAFTLPNYDYPIKGNGIVFGLDLDKEGGLGVGIGANVGELLLSITLWSPIQALNFTQTS